MDVVVITQEQLEKFKVELIKEIKSLLNTHVASGDMSKKRWYKASEVRKMLGISAGKLQHLRISGLLGSIKIGGVHYYDVKNINRLFNQ